MDERSEGKEEVKGRIVAAAVAKGGEGWRGKRGRCSHTKKLKGNPTAIGSATQECIEFRRRSRFAIEYTCTCTHSLNIIMRQDASVYAALSCKARDEQRTGRHRGAIRVHGTLNRIKANKGNRCCNFYLK